MGPVQRKGRFTSDSPEGGVDSNLGLRWSLYSEASGQAGGIKPRRIEEGGAGGYSLLASVGHCNCGIVRRNRRFS
jgi:hypothetical protein